MLGLPPLILFAATLSRLSYLHSSTFLPSHWEEAFRSPLSSPTCPSLGREFFLVLLPVSRADRKEAGWILPSGSRPTSGIVPAFLLLSGVFVPFHQLLKGRPRGVLSLLHTALLGLGLAPSLGSHVSGQCIQPGTILQYQTSYKQNISQSLAAKLPLSTEDEAHMKELAS